MYHIKICHLYPDRLYAYGDTGNLTILTKRMEWRGHSVSIDSVTTGEHLDPSDYDIIFIGDGDTSDFLEVISDFNETKAPALNLAIAQNKVILGIGHGFHLLGSFYETAHMKKIPLSGLLPFTIHNDHKRCHGDMILQRENGRILTGFENHRTMIRRDESLPPFGYLLHSAKDLDTKKAEGIHYKNTFGTHLHGPLLADNPAFADEILTLALQNKHTQIQLSPLDDSLEHQAHQILCDRYHISADI